MTREANEEHLVWRARLRRSRDPIRHYARGARHIAPAPRDPRRALPHNSPLFAAQPAQGLRVFF